VDGCRCHPVGSTAWAAPSLRTPPCTAHWRPPAPPTSRSPSGSATSATSTSSLPAASSTSTSGSTPFSSAGSSSDPASAPARSDPPEQDSGGALPELPAAEDIDHVFGFCRWVLLALRYVVGRGSVCRLYR
jgi:hypothetical protein